MGVKNVIKKIGDRAGSRVAKLSELSSYQVEEIQLQREGYLLEEPDPTDAAAVKRTERMMAASSIEIFNAYLPQIKELYLPVEKDAEFETPFDALHNIRYIDITKWVTDTKENSLPVLECAEFGRNVVSYDSVAENERTIGLGIPSQVRSISG